MNIVHGYGETAGDALVRHPGVPIITFTGSRATGVAVTKAAADNLKHVHLELGGKNAIIVLDDADVDLAVEGDRLVGVRNVGPALHRRVARDRAREDLRRAAVEARRRAPSAASRPGLGRRHRRRPCDQPGRDREDPLVHEDRQRRGRAPAHRRRGRDRGRPRQGLLLPPDDLRRRRRADAHRAGGDLRADDRADQGARLRRGDPRLERNQVRALVVDLHARREQGVPRDARPRRRHHVHQRRHDRRRGAPSVRRDEGHGQRAPRGGAGCARRLHRMEVDLRRLLRASFSARRSTTR